MGDCLLAAATTYGGWNLLADPATTVTIETGGALASHPAAYLTDGNQGRAMRWATNGANRSFKADLGSARKFTLLGIHGHNLDSGITAIEWYTSTTGAFAGEELLAAKMVPWYTRAAMYLYLGSAGLTKRYIRVVLVGTNATAPWLGEACLVSVAGLAAKAQHPLHVEHREAHVRHVTAVGHREVYEKTAWSTRYVQAGFKGTLAAREAVLDLYRAARGDLRPVLFLPRAPAALSSDVSGFAIYTLGEKLIIFGHLDPAELVEEWTDTGIAVWSIGIQEDPFTAPLL